MNNYIDLQVNGYGGKDFSSPDLSSDDVIKVADLLAAEGTTAFCPTLITSENAVYFNNVRTLSRLINGSLRNRLLGIHLEGPFISPQDGSRGCHPQKHIKQPDIEFMKQILDESEGTISIVTLAPEVDGAIDLISFLVEQNIAVSLGHHMASSEQIQKAVKAGARASTHLGNGIPKTLQRTNNPIIDQLSNERLTGMFITDGHHLPDNFVRLALMSKGLDKFIITSDAAPIAGLAPGKHEWAGNDLLLSETGAIYSRTSGTLAGSSSTMKTCAERLKVTCDLTDDEITQVTYHNPLKLLGLTRTQNE